MKKGGTDFTASYFYSILYRLSICVLPLVVTPYIARVLSPEDNGIYVFTSTVACVFIMFCKLGVDSYGNRSIAYVRDDRTKRSRVFWEIYSFQLAVSAVAVLLYIALIFLTNESKSIYLAQLLYVISGMFDISWYFYGCEKFKLTTIRSVIAKVMVIAGVFALVKTRDDLFIYTLVLAVCFMFEQVSLFGFLFREVDLVRVNLRDIKKHALPNFELFIPILALNIYHWADKLMLGVLCNQSEVSYYNYAESIINLPKGIIQALGTVMLPRISYLIAAKREKEGQRLLGDSIEFVCFICCALCFGIMGVSSVFIPIFLGDAYAPTIWLTIELSIVMIPMSISDIIQNQYLVPYKKDRLNIGAISMGAILNIIFNSFLIGPLGASGAVIATFAAELSVCAVLVISVRSFYTVAKLAGALLPFVFFGIAEMAVAMLLSRLKLALIFVLLIQVVCAGGVYLALSYAYFGIRKKFDASYRRPITKLVDALR